MFNHLYSSCIYEKLHKLPLPDVSSIRYDKIELMVIYLTGSMSVETWNGYLYAIIVIKVSFYCPVRKILKERKRLRKLFEVSLLY